MAKTINEIGHNLELKQFVIHQVVKDAGDRNTTIKLADNLIAITQKEKQFVGSVNKIYSQKSGPTYGIFGDDDNTFRELLKKYRTDNNFLSFSTNATNHYKSKISASAPATGGFIIYAHYLNKDNKNEYIFVLTINNKDGYVVSENDLTIRNIKNLDLSKIDIACRINLTKWELIEAGIQQESKTYLSFIKGKKDVSIYFMSFIDCADKTTSTESTKRLIIAIDSFCNEKGYNREDMIKKKNDIFDYCNDKIKRNQEILLSIISSIMDIENPNEFMEFAGDEVFCVSPIISGDPARLKRIKYVYYKDKEITVGFDNVLLNKDVFYDSQKKQLTFKNLPKGLVDELEK